VISVNSFKEPRRPASLVVYPAQTSCRVQLAQEQWNSRPQTLGVMALLTTPNRKSPKPEVARKPVIVQQPQSAEAECYNIIIFVLMLNICVYRHNNKEPTYLLQTLPKTVSASKKCYCSVNRTLRPFTVQQ